MLEYRVAARRIDAHGAVATAKSAEITLDTDLSGRQDALNPAELLLAAIERIETWRIDYNTARPHSSIDSQTPATFAAASVLAMQRGETPRYPRGFTPHPVAQTEPIGSNDERTLVPNG